MDGNLSLQFRSNYVLWNSMKMHKINSLNLKIIKLLSSYLPDRKVLKAFTQFIAGINHLIPLV